MLNEHTYSSSLLTTGKVVQTCHDPGCRIFGEIVIGIDVDGWGNARKTETEAGGQCKCGLEGEGTSRGNITQNQVVCNQLVRNNDAHIEVGNYAVKEELLTDHMP